MLKYKMKLKSPIDRTIIKSRKCIFLLGLLFFLFGIVLFIYDLKNGNLDSLTISIISGLITGIGVVILATILSRWGCS